MPSLITLYFINSENRELYKTEILNYLHTDFVRKFCPSSHFWHNREIIAQAFDEDNAVVALNRLKNVVGYMIWNVYNRAVVEIVIVEVKCRYRRRGLFNKIIDTFSEKFSQVSLLVALVVSGSREIFEASNKWQKWPSMSEGLRLERYIRMINQPLLGSSCLLPIGPAIAICSADYYQVQHNLDQYQSSMQYFSIVVNEQGQLQQPVIADFYLQECAESYVGIYLNGQLIQGGRIRDIFQNSIAYPHLGLIIIDRIVPHNIEFFNAVGFFYQGLVKRENLSFRLSQNTSAYFQSTGSHALNGAPDQKKEQVYPRKRGRRRVVPYADQLFEFVLHRQDSCLLP